MRLLSVLVISILLLSTLTSDVVHSEEELWFGPLKYKIAVSVEDPYDDYVVVSLELCDVNRTALQDPFVAGCGALKYIIVTFAYYSKFFDFNMTELFLFGNGTYQAYNYTFKLYFPIFYRGNWKLNITVVVWMLYLFVSMEIPISFVLATRVPYSRVPVNISLPAQQIVYPGSSWVGYWLYGLTGVVIAEFGLILYLLRKRR